MNCYEIFDARVVQRWQRSALVLTQLKPTISWSIQTELKRQKKNFVQTKTQFSKLSFY